MAIRTDLAAEQAARLGSILPKGIEMEETTREGVTVRRVKVSSRKAAEKLGKPVGDYYTIEGRRFAHSVDDSQQQIRQAAEVLRRLLPADGPVLVVGLGNRAVTPDALGPMVADRIVVTRHLEQSLRAAERLRETAVLVPGVLPQTGLGAAEQVEWAIRQAAPAAVVAVDALAAAEAQRLGRTIQISDAGITPGSGVKGEHLPLCRKTLGLPVIAVGVPMVIDAATFVDEYLRQVGVEETIIAQRERRPMMVAAHDVDVAVERSARCVALALNMALQPELSLSEIRTLTE